MKKYILHRHPLWESEKFLWMFLFLDFFFKENAFTLRIKILMGSSILEIQL